MSGEVQSELLSSVIAVFECRTLLLMWLLTLQLFKNSIDTREKLRLNLHALIECEYNKLLEYGR
jgi:hydrogenase-4 membrane subunit HyfE